MGLRNWSISPAEIFLRSSDKEKDRLAQVEMQEKQSASALNQMLTGQAHQADLASQAKQREGEESLAGLNEFLKGSPALADRLGRRTEGPMAEGVAGPGSPQFNPYRASGAGAPMLAEFVKGEMTNASAQARAEAAQNADLRNLFLKAGFERENLGITEGGKDSRQASQQDHELLVQELKELGLWDRLKFSEKGKTARNTEMAGAVAGESTFRTQMGQMDNYLKAIDSELMATRLDVLTTKDPVLKAQAQSRMAELAQLRQQIQKQFGGMLQPRGPAVTAPTAPAPFQEEAPTEEWARDPKTGGIRRVR